VVLDTVAQAGVARVPLEGLPMIRLLGRLILVVEEG